MIIWSYIWSYIWPYFIIWSYIWVWSCKFAQFSVGDLGEHAEFGWHLAIHYNLGIHLVLHLALQYNLDIHLVQHLGIHLGIHYNYAPFPDDIWAYIIIWTYIWYNIWSYIWHIISPNIIIWAYIIIWVYIWYYIWSYIIMLENTKTFISPVKIKFVGRAWGGRLHIYLSIYGQIFRT